MRALISATIAGVLLATATFTQAHHSGSIYDESKPVALQGVFDELEWVNPHVLMHLKVKSPDGKLRAWVVESNVPSGLRAAGLPKRRLESAVGTTVTMHVSPARDGSPLAFFNGMDFADGSQFRFPKR